MLRTLLPLSLLLSVLYFGLLYSNSPTLPTEDAAFCATSRQWQDYTTSHPAPVQQQTIAESKWAHSQRLRRKSGGGPYVIPVVFHLVHDNGPENLTDAQISAAVDLLNQSFTNAGPYNPATGEDTDITFCLAQRKPDGSLSTGIERIPAAGLTELNSDSEDLMLKNSSRYDPTQYLNVWVVREICNGQGCGVAGYAYLPGAHGSEVDGIVVEARWLGAGAAENAVLTHEAGHYLGLYHTFQGACTNTDCLTDGDQVCDTPPDQSTLAVPCDAAPNSCNTDTNSGFSTDQSDMVTNYMDYGDFDCYDRFTEGQCERMHFFLEDVRTSLLSSPGCLSPCPNPITLHLETDLSQDLPAGASTSLRVSGDNFTTVTWLLDGSEIGTGNPLVYDFPTEGGFVLTAEATNADPNCREVIRTPIRVSCAARAFFAASSFNVGPGSVVYFSNESSGADGYNWLIDGLSFSTDIHAFYQFDDSGVYEISLTANNNDCTDTYTVIITVDPNGNSQTGLPIWPLQGGGSTGLHTVDWRETPPATALITSLNSTFSGATGVAFDPCGDIAFVAVHTGEGRPNQLFLYAIDGSPLLTTNTPNGPGLNSVKSGGELQVIPVPNRLREWYLIYRAYGLDGGAPLSNAAYRLLPLLYSRVRLEADGTIAVLTRDQELAGPGSSSGYHDGLAVSRTALGQADQHFLYGVRRGNRRNELSLDRWLITETGISWHANTGSVNTGFWDLAPAGSHLELSPTEDRIVACNRNQSSGYDDYWIFDTNSFSNATAVPIRLDELTLKADGQPLDESNVLATDTRVEQLASTNNALRFVQNMPRKMARMEFSPNGRFLYTTNGGYPPGGGGYTYLTYLTQIDLNSQPMEIRLQIQQAPANHDANSGRSCTQASCRDRWLAIQGVESAYNGLLYFRKFNSTTLFVIPNPNNFMPQNLVPGDIDLSTPGQPNLVLEGLSGAIPDQIDGFNYLETNFTKVNFDVTGLDCGGNCRAPFTILVTSHDGSVREEYEIDECPTTIELCVDLNLRYRLQEGDLSFADAIVGGEVRYPAGRNVFDFSTTTACPEICDNGVDDDNDGLIDCADPDLAADCCCYTPPFLDLGPDLTLCENTVTILDAGPGFSNYRWTDFTTNPQATTAEEGLFGVTVTDACGDTQTDEVRITFTSVPDFDLGEDLQICPGEIVDFSLDGFLTYAWYPQDMVNCTDCAEVRFTLTDATTIIAVVSDENGCVASDTVQVSIGTGTVTSFTRETRCLGELVEVNGQLIGTDTLMVDSMTIGQCTRIDSLQYEFLPPIFTSSDTTACLGDTIRLFGEDIWTPGGYAATFTGSNGCDSTHNYRFTYRTPFELELISLLEVRWGNSVDLEAFTTAPADAIIAWEPSAGLSCNDCLTPSLVATNSGTYSLRVTDPAGCSQVATLQLVVDDEVQYYAPNVFSPNRDGINDRFGVFGDDLVAGIERLQVFDRWGELVYEGTDLPVNNPSAGWDGYFRGREALAGTYVYLATLQIRTGASIMISGDVLLLR